MKDLSWDTIFVINNIILSNKISRNLGRLTTSVTVMGPWKFEDRVKLQGF